MAPGKVFGTIYRKTKKQVRATKTYQRMVKILFLTVWVFLIMPVLKAQSDTLKIPRVGHHVFTPVTYSTLPLITSHFSTHTGLGITSGLVTNIGELPVEGLPGEVTFIEMGFAYQQKVRNWMAAYIDLTLSARLGTELQSILTQGFSAITSFNIGWHFRLAEGKKYLLSGIVELQNHQGSFTNVLGFVEDLLNDHPNPNLSETVPLLVAATGLRYAYGLNETIGFKASTEFAYGETYTRGEYGFSFDWSAGIDLNFYPRYSVPVGFVLIYDITSMPDFVYIEGERSQIIHAKIAYTKASDFSLGIELAYMKYPFSNQPKPVSVKFAALSARYYF